MVLAVRSLRPSLPSGLTRACTAALLMAAASPPGRVSINRQARRNYEILEDVEAGVSLMGTEVKSCRAGKMTLRDGFCEMKDGSCWLMNVNIARHATTGRYFNHDETRPRRLLLHKREILRFEKAVATKGLTLVPLYAYFNARSCLKLRIGLARGKKLADKRESIKARDNDREMRRVTKHVSFG